jgi:isoleucyl-tRNA synthetase
VHLSDFPKFDEALMNKDLEERMDLAQRISSMVLGLRRKVNLKVRQPLSRIMIPALDETLKMQIESVKDIILSEVNIKDIEFISDASGILTKKIKPNFKLLGKKFGQFMKDISQEFAKLGQQEIAQYEKDGVYRFEVRGQQLEILIEEAEITSEDIPGWLATNDGKLTVALDATVNEELRHEGIARELVNKIQNLRKNAGLNVTDKIKLQIQKHERINEAVEYYKNYIATQTLASSIELVEKVAADENLSDEVEIEENVSTFIRIN